MDELGEICETSSWFNGLPHLHLSMLKALGPLNCRSEARTKSSHAGLGLVVGRARHVMMT